MQVLVYYIYMGMLVAWLAAFPFIMLYGSYEGPKVFWLWIGGFVLAIVWVIRVFRSKKISFGRSDLWFFLWILVLLLASIAGIHPVDSIVGGSYRHQGVLFFFTLLLILLTVRTFSLKQKRVLTTFLAAGVGVESVVVILQRMSAWSARPLGTLGEPNAVAGFLAIGLFWIVSSDFAKRVRLLVYILTVAAIVATESRTGIVSMLIITLRFAWLRNKKIIIASTLGICLTCFFFMQVISMSRPSSVYESRPLFWQLAIREVLGRPILGYGAESGEMIYDQAFKRINIRLLDFMVDRSHNVFLDVTLWSGIVGLILFAGWCIASGKELLKRDRGRFIVFVAWFVFASLQPLGVVHWLQLIFLLSLV